MGYKILFLSRHHLMELLRPVRANGDTQETIISAISNLPNDAKIVAAHEDVRRQGVALVIDSSEYSPVPDGNVIEEIRPVFKPVCKWHLMKD